MKKENNKLLSIIVPCYKKARTISSIISHAQIVLDKTYPNYELIFVIDGISVDKTYYIGKKLEKGKIRVVGYKHNRGKGYALRYGMARAKGDIIGFMDGGHDLNPAGLRMLLAHFEWYNADIVVGSKWHPVSIVKYPFWRKILSRGYGVFVKVLFGLRVRDTQLGMKLYRKKVLEDVLPRLLVKKYACDIEMLAVADRIGYKRIYEAPVELSWDSIDSAIASDIYISIWEMFIDTLAVFYRLRIIKYYDSKSKRKWRYDPELDFRINIG